MQLSNCFSHFVIKDGMKYSAHALYRKKKTLLHVMCVHAGLTTYNINVNTHTLLDIRGWNVKKLIINQNFVDTVSPLLKNQMEHFSTETTAKQLLQLYYQDQENTSHWQGHQKD